jgi:putative transposase
MNRSRFNEEQINPILKEQESGMPAAEVYRRHGISSATFYESKSKFGRLDVCEARRLQELESEDAKLKRLLADTILDNSMPSPSPMASGTVRQRGFSRRSAGWPAPGWSCEPDLAVSGWRRQAGHAVRKFHRLDPPLDGREGLVLRLLVNECGNRESALEVSAMPRPD